jgi:hypothetical protein
LFYFILKQAERKPKILEEYRPDKSPKADPGFCYYLFEMKHDGVCPPEKTKISPGSVFIIMYVERFFHVFYPSMLHCVIIRP